MFLLEGIKKFAKTDKIALICRETSMSYAELDALSDAFAAWLLDAFPGEKSPVVIYGHKEPLILPCIYGALKAGRAYVPIDTTVPADRAQQIALDVEPSAAVDFYGVGLDAKTVLDAESLRDIFEKYRGSSVSPENWAKCSDFAYILFTSGSTGKPKGVPIAVENVENLNREFGGWLDGTGDVFLHQISYSFDVSVVQVWLAVARGKTLYTIDKGMVENLGELFENLERSGISVWVSTPSFAELCAPSGRFEAALLPKLEKFIFCGEVLTHKLVDQLFERFPAAKVINTYGPTEATVLVTASEITPEMAADERSIPIGEPLGEVRFRIADERGAELPEGEEGELLILSASVGPGYYRRPDLTEKAFFYDEATARRGYHTGDRAYRGGNVYYYCGRIDNQIKLNGFRVEIEDIENNLVKLENVARAAVLPVYEGEKVAYLAAFILLEQPDGLTNLKRSLRIKEQLREFLPSYMIPRRITALENFPLNTNGKVDKKQLKTLL